MDSQLPACLSLVLSPNCTPHQCRVERSYLKHCSPKIEEPTSLQASSPDSVKLRSIARDRWARPSIAMRCGRARSRMASWRIKRGTNQSLVFTRNLYERITRLWLFSAFPSNQTG